MSGKDFRFGISRSAQGVDLNELLITHRLSTFFMRVASDIPELELMAEDVLLVDRALTPGKNDLVVVSEPNDPELKILRFGDKTDACELWGVAEHVIRKLKT